ncbi:MAG: hypothetical protein AB8H79_00475 [Myxococcota bacterium]
MWPILMLQAAMAGSNGDVPERLYDAAPSDGRTQYFEALFSGDYDALDPIIDVLQRESADGDTTSTAVLGFAHGWRLSEFSRAPDPSVVQHAQKAVDTFEIAIRASPHDSRLLGFQGAFRQAVGSIEGRASDQRKGWFETKRSTRRWPEWGAFTQAYGLVSLDPSHRLYPKAIELMWLTLDECSDTTVPRQDLDWLAHSAVHPSVDEWDTRACLNTDVVEHNLEGFFLVFGDLYAKAGDVDKAKMMYDNALGIDPDATWPFRFVAQERLDALSSLPARFANQPAQVPSADPTQNLVFNGPISCAVCHQRSSP